LDASNPFSNEPRFISYAVDGDLVTCRASLVKVPVPSNPALREFVQNEHYVDVRLMETVMNPSLKRETRNSSAFRRVAYFSDSST